MALDVKRAVALSTPNALKVFLAPGTGLAQAVRAGLPPTTKEPQIQQAIQAASAEAERAKVSFGALQSFAGFSYCLTGSAAAQDFASAVNVWLCAALARFMECHTCCCVTQKGQPTDKTYSKLHACHHAGCISDNNSLLCLQEATASYAAVVPEGAMDAMYIALKQAISGHSPTIVPPVSKPLVLAGPFGSACHKGELLQWLLQEYGSSIALPEMVTTKPREDGAMATCAFKV